MKLIRVIQSKIVKKDNKYQVQSEKGRNLGTYDTKEQAEKRLKQVEMFKHMEKKSELTFDGKPLMEILKELEQGLRDYDYDFIDDEDILITIYDNDEGYNTIQAEAYINYDLGGYQPGYKGSHSYDANSPEEYYGERGYYEDFFLHYITITKIGDMDVHYNIDLKSEFGQAMEDSLGEYLKNPQY